MDWGISVRKRGDQYSSEHKFLAANERRKQVRQDAISFEESGGRFGL